MPRAAEPFGTLADRAVYLPESGTLVAADLHLGRAAASAVDAPLGVGTAIVDRLLDLIDRFQPSELVVAGDVLDAFDHVPRPAKSALDALCAGVHERNVALSILSGNHDTHLGPLLGRTPETTRELDDGTVVCHGHERPSGDARRYVIGHDHPSIVIEGRRRPCYLYHGSEGGGDLLVLPAFNPAVPGTPVNSWTDADPLSPFLETVSTIRPAVVDGQTHDPLVFPALGALQPHL